MAGLIRNAAKRDVEIFEAEDAKSALSAFRRHRPDAVFLDMLLAGTRGGLKILQEALKERPDARVILVTALAADHPDVVRAISLGAFAHVRKPIHAQEIQRVLMDIEVDEGRLRRIK